MDESIEKFFNWRVSQDGKVSAPVEIEDHRNRKYFWTYWNTNKEYLKSVGFSMTKENDGKFYIHRAKNEEMEERKKSLEESVLLSRAKDVEDYQVPSPEGLSYFGYQKAAIKFATSRDSTLIGDEPGLGKTIEIAGVINVLDDIKKVLIVCPASIRINWKRELSKWLIREFSIGVVDRSKYPVNSDIVIINFDVVHKHHEKLVKEDWDLLVIDEVHFLKSSSTRRSKYIFGDKKKIPKIPAKKRIFLSGTPIVNKPIELFPILHELDPETWSNKWKYAHRYCGAYHNGFGWDFNGSSNLDELQEKLRSTLMIRRLKKDVLSDLPPKFRQVVELPLDEKTARLVADEISAWEENETLISKIRASVFLARVNQDESEYRESVRNLKEALSKGNFSTLSSLREKVGLAKVPYVVEHIKDIDEKVVIFAHHKSVIRKLKEELGDKAVVLSGETSVDDRQSAIDRFQNDDTVRYFIGSIKAAGVGITLTSSSRVVFAELDWVPGTVSQCEDRCYRIGQKNNVLVQHLVLEGSLDSKMIKTIINKQEIIDKALDDEYDVEELRESPVYIEDKNSIKFPTKEEFKEGISEDEKIDLLHKLKFIAAFDLDRAVIANNAGFSKTDTLIGNSLASCNRLTDRQAVVARKLVKKYRRQLTVYETGGDFDA